MLIAVLIGSLMSGAAGRAAALGVAREEATPELRMDYDGAVALLDVLDRPTVTDAEIEALLAVPSVAAMVDNTTRFIPLHTRGLFREAVREYVSTGRSTVAPGFRLGESHGQAAQIKQLIATLRRDEDLHQDILEPLLRYLPSDMQLDATVYGVVGGASDGFVPDRSSAPAFYMALNRAAGDVEGVKLNMSHELFHVAQRSVRATVPGLDASVFDEATAAPTRRLLAVMHEEGAATYVAAPLLEAGSGPYIRMWRSAYATNAPADRIDSNFREFDRVFVGLHTGELSWDDASRAIFTGTGSPLYFVGYEVVKALDARHGAQRIARSLKEDPVHLFRDYIALYRECPACVPATFSAESERYIGSMPGHPR